jgi:hypothetical protein
MFVFERASPYEVMFEVTVGDKVDVRIMEAPRIVLEHEFTQLVEQAARYTKPVKVRMSRKVPIYDPLDKTTIEREHSVEFTNKAWNERN